MSKAWYALIAVLLPCAIASVSVNVKFPDGIAGSTTQGIRVNRRRLMLTEWRLDLNFLPPGKNHRRGHRKDGGEYVVPEATSIEDRIRGEILLLRFVPLRAKRYEMVIVFTFPSGQFDLDGPLAALIDCCFGARRDQRLDKLTATKQVVKGVSRTEVTIRELL